MFYKPKHCCQCAQKIEAADLKWSSSRRFCELCATEYGIHDWLRRAFFVIAAVIGLLGIGTYLQKPEKPLSVAPHQFASVAPAQKGETANPKTVAQVQTDGSVQQTAQPSVAAAQTKPQTATINLKTRPLDAAPIEAAEKVYFCGAATKKGTLCSRRVKGGGRCWQHEGQPAMAAQEKLLASQ